MKKVGALKIGAELNPIPGTASFFVFKPNRRIGNIYNKLVLEYCRFTINGIWKNKPNTYHH